MRALRASEVECRIGQVSKKGTGLSLLLYKDARVDMRMLDEEYGPDGWQCRYEEHKGTLFCGIGVRVEREGGPEWVWKWDAGSPSNMEAQKGEASDAFKRAGFRWGIGRELYTAPFIWVPADRCSIKDGKCWDKFEVTGMHVEDGHITQLTVVNAKTGQVVYQFGKAHDKLDGIRSLIRPYAQRRHIAVAEAKGEIERWAGVEDMSEIAEDFVPDVEAMMREVIASEAVA